MNNLNLSIIPNQDRFKPKIPRMNIIGLKGERVCILQESIMNSRKRGMLVSGFLAITVDVDEVFDLDNVKVVKEGRG